MTARRRPIHVIAPIAAALGVAAAALAVWQVRCRPPGPAGAPDAIYVFGRPVAPPAGHDVAAMHRAIADGVRQHYLERLAINIDDARVEARAQEYVSERDMDRAQLALLHAGELVEARFALDYYSGAVPVDGAAAELLHRIGPLLQQSGVELPALNDFDVMQVLLASFPDRKTAVERLARAERYSPEAWAFSAWLLDALQWEAILHRLHTAGELAGQGGELYEVAAVALPGDAPPRLEVLDPVVKLLCLQLLAEKKIRPPAARERDYRAYLAGPPQSAGDEP